MDLGPAATPEVSELQAGRQNGYGTPEEEEGLLCSEASNVWTTRGELKPDYTYLADVFLDKYSAFTWTTKHDHVYIHTTPKSRRSRVFHILIMCKSNIRQRGPPKWCQQYNPTTRTFESFLYNGTERTHGPLQYAKALEQATRAEPTVELLDVQQHSAVQKQLAEEGKKQLQDKGDSHCQAKGLWRKVTTLQRATQKLQANLTEKEDVLDDMTEIIRDLKGESSHLAAEGTQWQVKWAAACTETASLKRQVTALEYFISNEISARMEDLYDTSQAV
jgi:hypothetical protein